ncbi:MAG: hypothetical protein ABIN48_15850, partial [Ginsengibacter sp.]
MKHTHTVLMRIIFLLISLPLISLSAYSQYKTFTISVNGDTLNAIDQNNKKQGKWVIHVDPLRGERGYEEEGIFIND